MTRPVRPGVALAAAALAVALGGGASARAAQAPIVPIAPPEQQALMPASGPAHFAWASWQGQFGGARYYYDYDRLTWPDASIWTVGSLDGVSAGPFGTRATIIAPWEGRLDQRQLDDRESRSWVVSVDGAEWSLRDGESPELVARDVTGRVVRATPLPRRVTGRALTATADGLRIVAQRGRGLLLLDRRMRTSARWTSADRRGTVYVDQAEPLADGSVVVSAQQSDAQGTARLLIRLRPGHESRVLWRESNASPPFIVRAARAIVGAGDAGLVAIDDRGRVRTRAWNAVTQAAGLESCSPKPWLPVSAGTAANGRALFGLRCIAQRTTDAAIEIDARGGVVASYRLGSYDAASRTLDAAYLRMRDRWTTLPDGSIPAASYDAGGELFAPDVAVGWSTWRPIGSRPPLLGSVRVALGPRLAGGRSAIVRVVCRGSYGQRCSGVAEVRRGGEVVGFTRYSLPARPGGAAARDELPVALASRASAASLSVTARPLPPRPRFDPPRPAWDGSTPYAP